MYRRWTQTDYQNRSTKHSKGNKTVPGKVATIYTEDGHKETTKTGAQNIEKEIKQYQEMWLQHVQRMDTKRLPKQALQYKPKVATTCTEDGHKQNTETSTAI